MALDAKFIELTRNLVHQKEGEYAREKSQERQKILNDSASMGWTFPPGHVLEALDDMQVESIRKKKDIVWGVLEETLDAFNPPYYPELPDELFEFCESFFPERLCEPQAMGWNRPHAEQIQEQLRSELKNARYNSLHDLRTNIDLYTAKLRSNSSVEKHIDSDQPSKNEWDLFICHASEDKEDFVEPLAQALRQRGVKVWYDRFCIKWGNSIRQKIDEGLRSSKFGVVVFSQSFFSKKWPQNELDALYARMNAGKLKILPIWHCITESEVSAYSPLLSGIFAKTSEHGIEALRDEIIEILGDTSNQ